MTEYGTMLLRVTLSAIYLMQAYVALFVATPKGTATFLANMAGVPSPILLALVVIVIHGVGGGMLLLGLWTRLAAGANAAVLLVGIVGAYFRQGLLLKGALVDMAAGRATGAGYEYILLLVAATIAVASIGPGAWAVGK